MIHRQIPFCLTLTRTGERVPDVLPNAEKLKQHIQVDQANIALRKIFDLRHRMDAVLNADVSSELLDLNKLPEAAVQNTLNDQTKIYPQGNNQQALQQGLLEQYYYPFFNSLEKVLIKNEVKIGFNCALFNDAEYHSVDSVRPILSLQNGGDFLGEKQSSDQTLSCPAEMIRDIRDIFSARFADVPGSVLLNVEKSNHDAVQYQQVRSIPWIELLVGRSLLENSLGTVGEKRIENLRDRFENVFVMISKYYEWL